MEPLPKTEKRRAFIIQVVYFTIIVGLFYLFMHFAFWPAFPFLLAFAIAYLLQRPINYITRKTPVKRGLASAVLILLALVVLVGLIVLVGAKLVGQVRGFIDYIQIRINDLPNLISEIKTALLGFLSFLPDSIEQTVDQALTGFFDKLVSGSGDGAGAVGAGLNLSMFSAPIKGAWNAARQIPTIFLATVVSIVCCIFMTIDFPQIKAFIYRQIPEKRREVIATSKRVVTTSIGKLAKTYLLIICITFVELMLGFKVLQLLKVFDGRYIVVLALAIAIVDILPVLGTGTVLIPWALYSLIVGNTGLGVGLLVIYLAITVIRQYIEPKLVSVQLGLPPFVTLMAMYFGLKLFGFIGLFLMPMLVILLKILNDQGAIHLWKRGEDETQPAPGKGKDADGNGVVSVAEEVEQPAPKRPFGKK